MAKMVASPKSPREKDMLIKMAGIKPGVYETERVVVNAEGDRRHRDDWRMEPTFPTKSRFYVDEGPDPEAPDSSETMLRIVGAVPSDKYLTPKHNFFYDLIVALVPADPSVMDMLRVGGFVDPVEVLNVLLINNLVKPDDIETAISLVKDVDGRKEREAKIAEEQAAATAKAEEDRKAAEKAERDRKKAEKEAKKRGGQANQTPATNNGATAS